MLTILGGLAEFERSLIKARTDVGVRRAREAGIRFGRPPKLTKHQQEQAMKLIDQGEPQSAIARLLAVDQSTISRLASRSASTTLPRGIRPARADEYGNSYIIGGQTPGRR
jgi:DNA invertase Pin-like site-specific DNA recombinase